MWLEQISKVVFAWNLVARTKFSLLFYTMIFSTNLNVLSYSFFSYRNDMPSKYVKERYLKWLMAYHEKAISSF